MAMLREGEGRAYDLTCPLVSIRCIVRPSRLRRYGGTSRRFPMRHRASRHLCLGCRSQRARFRYRGRVRADRDHTLCFRCYRSLRDRVRLCAVRGW